MRKLILASLFALAAIGANAPASAQNTTGLVIATCGTVSPPFNAGNPGPFTIGPDGKLCVNATVSASITGFNPTTTGTPIAATTGGVTGTLPTGTVVVATNVGTTNGSYCKLGASATTSDQYIAPNGGWFQFTVSGATQLTCITSAGTTTVNMVGGSGLPTGTGGGGGGSGGGGAITAANGAIVTLGTITDPSCDPSAGACTQMGIDAFIAAQSKLPLPQGGAIGSTGDAQCPTATSNCTLDALLKFLNVQATSGLPSSIGTRIGVTQTDQTTPGTTDLVHAAQQGTWTMSLGSTGGATPYHLANATTASNNSTLISTGAHTLLTLFAGNTSGALGYLKIYDLAGAPTCSSATGLKHVYPIPFSAANAGGFVIPIPVAGEAYALGLGFCVTSGQSDTDNSNGPAAISIEASYK